MKETKESDYLTNLPNYSSNNKNFINYPLGNNSNTFKKKTSNEILYFSINQDSK